MALGGLVQGSLIVYLKGMRIMMFQLSGYYYNSLDGLVTQGPSSPFIPTLATGGGSYIAALIVLFQLP